MQNRSRSINAVVVLVLSIISGILLLAGFLTTPAGRSGPLSAATAFAQQVVSSAAGPLIDVLRALGEINDLRQRAQTLEREAQSLRAEMLRLQEFQAEAVQYRQMLNFPSDLPSYLFVGADVIGSADIRACEGRSSRGADAGKCANVIAGETSAYVRYITINRGSRDGIRVGMPVVGGGLALVGRVAEVDDFSAKVQLLTDPSSFINVRLLKTRASGTVAGSDEGRLILQNVLQTEAIQPGDAVVTSGLGGLLPRGLVVGTVDTVLSSDVETLQSATVRPAVNFDTLEVVLVLTQIPPALLTPEPPLSAQ